MNFFKAVLGTLTGGLIGGGVLGGSSFILKAAADKAALKLIRGDGGGGGGGSLAPQLPKAPVTPDAMLVALRKRRSAMLMGNIALIPTLLGGAQPQGPAKSTLLGE